MASIADLAMRNARNNIGSRTGEMHGLVTSYDPKNHLGKVTLQPEGEESGWLSIHNPHIGKTYGMLFGLQTGNGNQSQDATGGNASGSGSSSQSSQQQGDQVIVSFHEEDGDSPKIMGRVHSQQDSPPQVQSGEGIIWTVFKQDSDAGPDSAPSGQSNNTGQKVFLKNDGSLNIEDGAGAACFLDGKGNTTNNAIGTHTTQIIQQRDGSPFDSLTGQPMSGSSPTQIHHTTLDKNKGVKTGAFQDQHTTTWDNNGVTHTSSSTVTSKAPSIPHIGSGTFTQNLSVGQNLNVTQVVTAEGYDTSSDIKLKTKIADLPSAIDRIMEIRPRTFDKKNIAIDENGRKSIGDDTATPSSGYIAQELREIFPELVRDGEFLSVNEGGINIRLLKAFQEFVVETRREIAELKANDRRLGGMGL